MYTVLSINTCRRKFKNFYKLILIVGIIILNIVYYIYISFNRMEADLKHILLWAPANNHELFKYIDLGQDTFYLRKCLKKNCYLTDDKKLLNNINEYDAIVFHGPDIFGNYNIFPTERSLHQKYIFASRTSAEDCVVPNDKTDGYFNLTWTYRIDSDIPLGYITVKDINGKIIGPKEEMHWLSVDEMDPISDDLIDLLDQKSTAVAWFSSNCKTSSERELYVANLSKELSKYDLELDIYGACGSMLCPKILMQNCLYRVEIDYYFYLAFENSFSDDYVTECLLHALQNYAVPIVYGGANYTRFMPDGIYLDANKMNPEQLAYQINDIIGDMETYYNFFRWQSHYSYHYPEESNVSDPMCKLCEAIHDDELMRKNTVVKQFQSWWNVDENGLLS